MKIHKDPETGIFHRDYDNLPYIKAETCYNRLFPLITKKDTVLDIGAQVGYQSVRFSKLAKKVFKAS
jgi:hypothetical protein